MENTDDKREQILEAAAKRFAHFGLSKTTMQEIAKDLSFSKALLYYYFSDKDAVYLAVLENITDEMTKEINVGLKKQPNIEKAVLYYLTKRQSFIEKYYKLLIQVPKNPKLQSPKLQTFYHHLLQIEVDRISTIFEEANKRGETDISDCKGMARLLLSAISGLRFSLFQTPQAAFTLDIEKTREVFRQQTLLVRVFCKGLTQLTVK